MFLRLSFETAALLLLETFMHELLLLLDKDALDDISRLRQQFFDHELRNQIFLIAGSLCEK